MAASLAMSANSIFSCFFSVVIRIVHLTMLDGRAHSVNSTKSRAGQHFAASEQRAADQMTPPPSEQSQSPPGLSLAGLVARRTAGTTVLLSRV